MSRLGRATLTAVLWSNLGVVATRVLSFAALLVLARLVAPDAFGVVAAVTVFLGFVELAADLGMKSAVIYEQEEGVGDRVQTAFTVNVVIAAALAGLGALAAPLVAGFFGLPEHTDLFRLAALIPLLAGLGNVHDGLLMRELDFRRRLRPELARAVVRAGVSVGLALREPTAAALVWGALAGTAAWTAVLWATVPLRPRLRFDPAIARSLLGYGAGSAALVVLSTIGSRIDVLAVGRVLGERALGLYTIAWRVPELAISTVAWQLSWVLFPALSRKRAEDAGGVAAMALGLLRVQALYLAPVAAGLAVLATPLTVVLFGARWEPAGAVMSAVALLTAIDAALVPLGDALKATARQRLLVGLNLVRLPMLVLTVVLVAGRGIEAVAWARVAGELAFAAGLTACATRALDLRVRAVGAALAPGAVAGLGTAAGAGAMLLAWDGPALLVLCAAGAAGVAGGLLALRLLAGPVLGELVGTFRALRAASPAPA